MPQELKRKVFAQEFKLMKQSQAIEAFHKSHNQLQYHKNYTDSFK